MIKLGSTYRPPSNASVQPRAPMQGGMYGVKGRMPTAGQNSASPFGYPSQPQPTGAFNRPNPQQQSQSGVLWGTQQPLQPPMPQSPWSGGTIMPHPSGAGVMQPPGFGQMPKAMFHPGMAAGNPMDPNGFANRLPKNMPTLL